MQDPDHHNPLDDQWIRSQLDGQLSATEAEAFNDRLRSDATFRRRFVQLADLETTMLQLCGNSKTEHSVSKAAGRSSPKLWSWNSIVMITAGVLLLLASTVLLSLQKQLQIAQMEMLRRQSVVEQMNAATRLHATSPLQKATPKSQVLTHQAALSSGSNRQLPEAVPPAPTSTRLPMTSQSHEDSDSDNVDDTDDAATEQHSVFARENGKSGELLGLLCFSRRFKR